MTLTALSFEGKIQNFREFENIISEIVKRFPETTEIATNRQPSMDPKPFRLKEAIADILNYPWSTVDRNRLRLIETQIQIKSDGKVISVGRRIGKP